MIACSSLIFAIAYIVVINQDRFRTAFYREFRPGENIKPECLLLKLQHNCSKWLNEAHRDRSNINVKCERHCFNQSINQLSLFIHDKY